MQDLRSRSHDPKLFETPPWSWSPPSPADVRLLPENASPTALSTLHPVAGATGWKDHEAGVPGLSKAIRAQRHACLQCSHAKKRCDDARPCGSCVRRGCADKCSDPEKPKACSLCRSRRVKCDRQRPCSRCVRSGRASHCDSAPYTGKHGTQLQQPEIKCESSGTSWGYEMDWKGWCRAGDGGKRKLESRPLIPSEHEHLSSSISPPPTDHMPLSGSKRSAAQMTGDASVFDIVHDLQDSLKKFRHRMSQDPGNSQLLCAVTETQRKLDMVQYVTPVSHPIPWKPSPVFDLPNPCSAVFNSSIR
jgi:hypothetical protein